MPIDYSKYPADWKTRIRPEILKRAGNRCEKCGVENGVFGYRDRAGVFHRSEGLQAEADKRIFRIVLTVAHLNHDRTDNRRKISRHSVRGAIFSTTGTASGNSAEEPFQKSAGIVQVTK